MRHSLFQNILLKFFLIAAIFNFSLAVAAIDPDFSRELDLLAPYDEVSVIVTMKEMPRPESHRVHDRRKRNGNLVRALKKHAETSQIGIRRHLKNQRLKHTRDMWIINGLALTLRADQIKKLAEQPGVVNVRKDEVVTYATTLGTTGSYVPEWNLSALHLPDLWSAGLTGSGVVVATMDTGVDISHPDIASKWRGGKNSWFDPNAQHITPYDAIGHGTQVMGILVGGDSSGVKIGAAPDAKFIAAKIFNDSGSSTYSAIHAAFQWMLDPDNDPSTQDMPDVVNASWGLPGTNNKCNVEFDSDIRMLNAANIAVVFAGGNDGPAPATGVSPANSAGILSTGSVGTTLDISSFSSRGPSPCTASTFPILVAPGDSIYTTDVTSTGSAVYTTVAGTSFAAPHVAGVLALLAGKFPGLTVADLENAVKQTVQDLGDTGADNSYGAGLVNANSAMLALNARPAGGTPVITSIPPVIAMQGVAYSYQVVATDADGDALTYSLDVAPSGMDISASGKLFWIPGSNQAGQQLVTLRVTDTTGLYSIQTFVVVVETVNNAPVANDDNYIMVQASVLTVPAAGVLTNDTDRDSNQLVAVNFSAASIGTLAANEDGSLMYIPPTPLFVGIVTFTYQASDGALNSAAATVTINVLPASGSPLTRTTTPVFPIIPQAPMTVPGSYPVDTGNEPAIDPVSNTTTPETKSEEKKNGDQAKDDETAKKDALTPDEGSLLIDSLPVETARQGDIYFYQVTVAGESVHKHVYTLDVAPEGMTINEIGLIKWQPKKGQTGAKKVVVRVTDTPKLFTLQSFSIETEHVNEAPVAMGDSFVVPQASVITVNAPGVLANDSDPDLTQLQAVNYSQPSAGKLEGRANGSFVYTPPTPDFTGNISFYYKAGDGELMSEDVTVKIKIVANRAPIANDDFVNARAQLPVLGYTALPVNILANDLDPDTEFDQSNRIAPETLKIVSPPSKGGALKIDVNGMVSYTPAPGFRGIDTFKYNVKDTRNAVSKTATVQVNVK